MKSKILITGGTGFIGTHLIPELLKTNVGLRCLVRSTSNMAWLKEMKVELVLGDLRNFDAIVEATKRVDGVVHLATANPKKDISFDETNILGMKNIVSAMCQNRIKRIIFTSSSVALSGKYRGRYGDSKLQEQNILKDSPLDYTILIPSQVYGGHYNKNLNKLLQIIKKFPVTPVLGKGEYKIQPLYVKDFVKAIVSVLVNERTIRKEYFIAGPNSLTYNELVNLASSILKVKRFKLHIPLTLLKGLSAIIGKVSEDAFITIDKINRSTRDNVFDILPAREDFGFDPTPLEEGIRLTAQSL